MVLANVTENIYNLALDNDIYLATTNISTVVGMTVLGGSLIY